MINKSKMSRFRRGIVPIVLPAIMVRNRRIQRFVEVKFVEAHDVHIDIRVPRSVRCIHAIKYMNPTLLAKRVMRYRVFALIFRQSSLIGKETKLFPPNRDVPESQLATVAAIAFPRTIVEINPSFKPH